MKVNKETIKNYWEKHKKEICIITGSTVCLTVGAFLGYEYCRKVEIGKSMIIDNPFMIEVMDDALKEYPKGMSAFSGAQDTPIKLNELGELGKLIKSYGAPDEASFTHFICMGKPMK